MPLRFVRSSPRRRYGVIPLLMLAAVVSFAGCSSVSNSTSSTSATGGSVSTPIATLAPTPTPPPIPTVPSVVSKQEFTCPEKPDGSEKTIADSTILLTVSYPGSWKEAHCTQTKLSDGNITIWIGNYVHIDAVPDTDISAQQWVDAHKTTYETITLQPITVRQAREAVIVTDQLDQSAPSPFDFYFAQIRVLLRGTRYLYELGTPLDVAYDTSTDTAIPGPLPNYVGDWSVS